MEVASTNGTSRYLQNNILIINDSWSSRLHFSPTELSAHVHFQIYVLLFNDIFTKLDLILSLPSQGFHCQAGVSVASISIVTDVCRGGGLRAGHFCGKDW